MMHELTFSDLVVESQYLLKLQSHKITKKYCVLSQLNALVRCHFHHFRLNVCHTRNTSIVPIIPET